MDRSITITVYGQVCNFNDKLRFFKDWIQLLKEEYMTWDKATNGMTGVNHLSKRSCVEDNLPVDEGGEVRMANKRRQDLRPKDPTTLDSELEEQHLPDGLFWADIRFDGHRHLVLASARQLKLLAKAKSWYMDATFKVVFQKIKDIQPRQVRIENFVLDFEDGSWSKWSWEDDEFEDSVEYDWDEHRLSACIKTLMLAGLQFQRGGWRVVLYFQWKWAEYLPGILRGTLLNYGTLLWFTQQVCETFGVTNQETMVFWKERTALYIVQYMKEPGTQVEDGSSVLDRVRADLVIWIEAYNESKHNIGWDKDWLKKYTWLVPVCSETGEVMGMLCNTCRQHNKLQWNGEMYWSKRLVAAFGLMLQKAAKETLTKAMKVLAREEISHTTTFSSLLDFSKDYLSHLNLEGNANYRSEEILCERLQRKNTTPEAASDVQLSEVKVVTYLKAPSVPVSWLSNKEASSSALWPRTLREEDRQVGYGKDSHRPSFWPENVPWPEKLNKLTTPQIREALAAALSHIGPAYLPTGHRNIT
ncbi:Hypp5318 [Branchiostoma lanceolatum]|uniref:Hypp5318 protein n=1 Tax=Branchiostoma lanceolatum TaxID=7740 RepID=A0A8K0AI86_BRALA|nr:Hypp5318 [Branchiostoma lanceolatum]